jgi:hypothetical protein
LLDGVTGSFIRWSTFSGLSENIMLHGAL